jgi:1-acyl-sn-glycerol-3-phosphate acyltransferase
MNGSRLLGLRRIVPYLIFTILLMPIQALAVAFKSPLSLSLPLFYHRWAARMLGLEVVVRGEPSKARPTLFVANHTSYLDIEVLASILKVSFIAKAEMSDWPFFGWLAKLQRSVFVDRKRTHVGDHTSEVAKRLAAGDNLVLFAEGTSSDGNRLLPFKSALFSVAEQASAERPLTIQPVSVVATALDGMPLGRSLRPIYAWYGDMPLLSHAWQAATLGRLTVVVEFHPAFTAGGQSRKEMAARCQAEVGAGIARAITGRFDTIEDDAQQQHDDPSGDGEKIEAAA